MRIFKHLLPFILGVLFILLLNAALNYMLIPYQFTRVKVHKVETETFDDLILGSSHGGTAFDPTALTAETGRSSYNACAGGQFPMDNYYLLLDALREHAPKRVIFEYDPNYWISLDPFNRTARYQESVMAPSAVRFEYFSKLLLPGDIRYVLMPWSLYESGLKDIRRIVARKQSDDYKNYAVEPFNEKGSQACDENGFLGIPDDVGGDPKIPDLFYTDGMEHIVAKNREYFEKIVRLCQKKEIELVVVTTPVPAATREATEGFYYTAHEWMKDLSTAYGFTYLDFVLPSENKDALPDLCEDPKGFSDGEGHMHISAARNFTQVLASYL